MLDIKARFNQDALVADFPEIEKLLDNLKDSVFFRARIHDKQHRLMGAMEIDSVSKIFTIQLRILNGRLLPLNAGSDAVNKNGFSLIAPGCKQLYIAYDIHLNLVGLRLDIESLPIAVDYLFGDDGLVFKACLWQPPNTIAAGGWAFGFIPLWLVDVLIPSNVEELTRNFFQTLALGNDRQGTIIELESSGAREQHNIIRLQSDSEVLANGTIKLAFNLQRKLIARQQALLKEIRAFNNQLLDAFYLDYQRVKARRGCQ